jgi:hypothetical protein
VFPTFSLNALKHTLTANTDTLDVLLITSGTYTWGATPETQTHVSEFLAGDGTNGALGEVLTTGGTNYTRQPLSGVTLGDSGLTTMLDCNNPSWAAATFSAKYALFYDSTVGGTDSTNQMICYWDFGSSQSVTATSFTLTINVAGLVTWTSS